MRPSRRTADDPAISVLPFVNLSGEREREWFADAMTDALITELTRCGTARVISRTSSMAYKGRGNGLPDIAEELGVDWVVLGSVIEAGGEIRVTAQLVDATSDENRWARSFTRKCHNLLSMQSEVAETIAQEVSGAISPKAAARPLRAAG